MVAGSSTAMANQIDQFHHCTGQIPLRVDYDRQARRHRCSATFRTM